METVTKNNCINCGEQGNGKYCSTCGEEMHVHHITLGHMLHEVFHLFTHFDKGLLYTLKQLITRPGFMQHDYIEGKRKQHQKPFAMFFVCGTITALAVYWINKGTANLHGGGDQAEEHYFQHYFALIQMALVPVYALAARYTFNWRYNYAEYLVILLYNTSVLFLFIILANTTKLIFGGYETGYVEVVFVLLYNVITYLNLFQEHSKAAVIFKTVLSSVICFAVSRVAMELFLTYGIGSHH